MMLLFWQKWLDEERHSCLEAPFVCSVIIYYKTVTGDYTIYYSLSAVLSLYDIHSCFCIDINSFSNHYLMMLFHD